MNPWTGAASDEFLAGLGLFPSERAFRSYGEWYSAALRAGSAGPTVVAVNAGEVPVSRKGALRMLTLAMLILWMRVRGGRGVWVGAGVPRQQGRSFLAWPYALVAGLCEYVRFRDDESRAVVAVTGGVAPDWAFALGTATGEWKPRGDRSLLAIVIRGDRERPSSEWISWIKETADLHGLAPVVVVQVRRDAAMAAWLAGELGGSVSSWESCDHRVRETEVRRIYAESALVVGDRLHGLIVGATEGALPLGWVETSAGKVRRHFDTVGLEWPGGGEGRRPKEYGALTVADMDSMRDSLVEAVDRARSRLDSVGREMVGCAR
ncbi:polysaccharide pyruvyl transferase family protein [Prescottella agglutinans]|uniref:polysaccharide pyruvyl transferase family protein n=1 Tax=Prescottella agglutinans TaxID=1644129 RepID=UPI000FDD10F7|nr:polysaccharide pyruvyl transferase family protein [Prescottella agglutinans]